MAIETPLHLQRRGLVHQRHLVDRAVTGITADAFIDVNAVIEINEIRNLVHARPLDRPAAAETLAHGLEKSGIGPDLRMAVHAGLGGRNACEAGYLNRSVAVPTVNTEPGHVMLMAEGHRLRPHHARISNVRGTLDLLQRPAETSNDEHGP